MFWDQRFDLEAEIKTNPVWLCVEEVTASRSVSSLNPNTDHNPYIWNLLQNTENVSSLYDWKTVYISTGTDIFGETSAPSL